MGKYYFSHPHSSILKKLDSFSTDSWGDHGDSAPHKAPLVQLPQCSRLLPTSSILRAHISSSVTRADSILTVNVLESKATAKASVHKPVSLSRSANEKLNLGFLLCSITDLHSRTTYSKTQSILHFVRTKQNNK